MEEIAKGLQLNVDKFKTDMGGDKCKNDVNGTMAFLSKMGVHGTPAFFINGRYISGAQPIENFKSVIDEEIKKADAAIAAGTKAEDYYKTAIVEKGKKSL
jgi:predicted DsbA family dithiol-disulfide isomerase